LCVTQQTKGYEPEALLNFVALMGMNHSRHQAMEKNETTTSDLMTMEQMTSMFSLDMVSKHRATMSQPKLVHLNQQHIGRGLLSTEPERVRPWIVRARALLEPDCTAGQVSDEYVHRVLLAMKARSSRIPFVSSPPLPPPPLITHFSETLIGPTACLHRHQVPCRVLFLPA